MVPPHLKRFGFSTPHHAHGRVLGGGKDDPESSHAPGKAPGVQLGGALSSSHRCTWSTDLCPAVDLAARFDLADVLVPNGHQRNQCARSYDPLAFFFMTNTYRQTVFGARPMVCQTRAFHCAWCAPYSGPPEQSLRAIGALRCKPLGPGVPVPQDLIGSLPMASRAMLSTVCTGRAEHVRPLESCPPGTPWEP